MTTSTYHPAARDKEAVDTAEVAKAVCATVASRMQLSEAEITQAMARTVWSTIKKMIQREFAREFTGSYRRYYPKCAMAIRDEAVIAEVYDLLAIAFDDPHCAIRSGAWTLPATRSVGRSNG